MIAVLAMLLPGTDPVTMLISMVPLIILFEFSLILARIFDRRRAEADAEGGDGTEVVAQASGKGS